MPQNGKEGADVSMAFSHPVEVRFRDLDALGHVNHATIVTYLEVARTAWWRQRLEGRSFREEGFLIARVEMDYRKPILLGDDIAVALRVAQVGSTSFALVYQVLRRPEGMVLAEGQSVQVMMDFQRDRPTPLSADLQAWLRRFQ